MGIIEAAIILREIAIDIAIKNGITEQQAWDEALEEFKKQYEIN